MPVYYLDKNAQTNGEYHVHEDGCTHMPLPSERTYLGNFSSVQNALEKASRLHHRCRACHYCCETCHID